MHSSNILTLCQGYLYSSHTFNTVIRNFIDYSTHFLLFINFVSFSIVTAAKVTDFKKGPLRKLMKFFWQKSPVINDSLIYLTIFQIDEILNPF